MRVREDSTRRKLLQIRKLDLAGVIYVCRSSETAARQLKEFKGVEDVKKVTGRKNRATNYQPQRSKSRERNEWKSSTDTRQKSCKYCGKAHEFRKELCAAFGKKCNSWPKLNHCCDV